MDFLDKQSLLELEDLCVQQQPPAALAACPLHVDCRALCAAVARGDFDGARAIYSRSVTFPALLSQLCDMPCGDACPRRDLGGSLDLPALERAAMNFGKAKPPPPLPRRAQGKMAIVGAGICGLAAARELSKKGYTVTVFERDDRAGGGLRQSSLSPELLEREWAALGESGVIFRFSEDIEKAEALLTEFDALLLATGERLAEAAPVSFATEIPGLFAAGGQKSAVFSMAAGKSAAGSMERYIKRVSLTAGREAEGVFETRLYVETKGIEVLAQASLDGRTPESAMAEAARCLNCQCMACGKTCAFIAHFKRYPRLYLREIYNNLSIVMGNHTANELINACAICGQCAAVCPYGLDLGEVVRAAREQMVRTRKMPPSAFEFALDEMRRANSERSFLARRQPDFSESRYLFFPGCQLTASVPELVKETYAYLCEKLQGGVALVLSCCGIPAQWAGETEVFADAQEKLRVVWEDMGRPVVITACPNCRKSLSSVFSETKDIWEVFLEEGLPTASPSSLSLTVHDACGAREMARTRQAVRQLLRRMGCRISETKESGERSPCCGYGGLVPYSHPEMAREMTDFCLKNGDGIFLTYCINCRDRFNKGGARAIHLLQLIFGMLEEAPIPGYSLRQDRREELKRSMLEEFWREAQPREAKPRLFYDEEVAALLEQRLILEDDIRAVIEEANRTERYIQERLSGWNIAGKRIGHVTFWVYYAPEEDGWRIHRAYSHRMEIR